jgi:hypothetical protein
MVTIGNCGSLLNNRRSLGSGPAIEHCITLSADSPGFCEAVCALAHNPGAIEHVGWLPVLSGTSGSGNRAPGKQKTYTQNNVSQSLFLIIPPHYLLSLPRNDTRTDTTQPDFRLCESSTFMSKNTLRRPVRNIALEDVSVGAANRGSLS